MALGNLLRKCIMLACIVSMLMPMISRDTGESVYSLSMEIAEAKMQTNGGLQNSSWPMFHHDVLHSGRSSNGVSGNWYNVKWKFRMDGGAISSPIIDFNGTIYIGASNFQKSFFAINSNGTEKWDVGVEEFIWSSPAVNFDNIIYVGSNDGNLYAFNPNGTKKWLFETGDWVYSSPTIGIDGTIYVGSYNDYLYAMNPNGTEKWRFKTGDSILSSAAIDDNGIIYFGSHDTYLYALYPNGTMKWRYKTNERIKGSPSIGDDGTIYICSWDSYLYAINRNGTLKWKFATGDATETTPAIAQDGTIYIGSYDGKIYSIAPNGSENWVYQTSNDVISSPAIDKNGVIYCGSEDGNLYVFNPNGTLLWKFHAGDSIVSSVAIDKDGTIYIAGQFEAKCDRDSHTYLYALQIIINKPPSTPAINGPHLGKAKQNYNYSIVSTDPDGNNISYYVDWGDGTNTGWIGPFNSGHELTVNHTWTKQGTYTIKVKAMDNYCAESGWGTLSVTMPLSYEPPHFRFFEWLLDRFPRAFPMLRLLLDR